ncbi:MAG: YceI family protein [Thermoleophilia bacterium]
MFGHKKTGEETANATTATAASIAPVGTWQVDPAHSSIGFEVKHMMIATVRGRFDDFEGSLSLDETGEARVQGVIRTASINTNEPQRDGHLRSADFFDAETYPEIQFSSQRIEHVRDDRYRITGNITIKDVTREIVLDAEAEGVGTDPWGNQRAAVRAVGELDRTDFGLRWNQALETGGILVGEKVRLVVDISAVLAAQEQVV